MKDKDMGHMLEIIHEIFESTVKIFEKNNFYQGGKVDFVLTKVFVAFYANSLLFVPKESRQEYFEKRTNLLAEEMVEATEAIIQRGDEIFNKLEGVCNCDKCKKNRADKETSEQTIH